MPICIISINANWHQLPNTLGYTNHFNKMNCLAVTNSG